MHVTCVCLHVFVHTLSCSVFSEVFLLKRVHVLSVHVCVQACVSFRYVYMSSTSFACT